MKLDIVKKGKPVLHKNGPSESTFYVHRELPPRLKENLKYLGMVYAKEELGMPVMRYIRITERGFDSRHLHNVCSEGRSKLIP